jgi:hypothetical protein
MKNFLSVIIIISSSFCNSFSQIAIGVKAGLNFNDRYFGIDQVYNYPVVPAPSKTKLGYHFGVNVIYELNEVFSLNTGLSYINKGSSIDLVSYYNDLLENSDVSVEGYARDNYNYLEIPLQLSYNIWKGLMIYGGPYAAFGIAGRFNYKYKIHQDGTLYTQLNRDENIKPAYSSVTLKLPSDNNGGPILVEDRFEPKLNGFDYGLNLGLGYQLNKILISSEYSLGLGNVTPNYTNFGRDIHRHRILYFSVGYQLFEK